MKRLFFLLAVVCLSSCGMARECREGGPKIPRATQVWKRITWNGYNPYACPPTP